jgi:UDP:flavonoid glycosyltransferase YjiC (YdhE family)
MKSCARRFPERGGTVKILLASLAIDGHFNPLTSIGKRLQANGHDVRWYTGSRYESRLAELGIPHFPFRRAVQHTPENLNELYPERALLKGPRAAAFDGEKVFASNVGNFFDDMRDIRADFPFDLLLEDGAVFVQRLITEILGVPVISVIAINNMQRDPLVPPLFFGLKPATSPIGRLRDRALKLLSDRLVTAPGQRRYASILADVGLTLGADNLFTDEPYVASAAVIQSGTLSFEYPRSVANPKVHYVGPLLPYRGSQSPPLTFTGKLGRYGRTVLVTQGTVDNKDPAKLIAPAIEALKDTDTLVVVATGSSGTAALRHRYPGDNVVIEDQIDFDAALKHANAYVTNGGFGGVMLSLANGVPLVCAGITEGKNDVNAHVDYHRVGIDLRTDKPKPESIRRAVDRVCTEPEWKARAEAYQAEISELDPPAVVEQLVSDLVPAH